MINSLFRRPFKFSVSFVSSSLFPGVPSSNYHGDPSKSLQGFTLCFQFLFLFIPFVYRSSSWRFYMTIHQGCNSFSKFSSRFISRELKLSSYCNPECNFFLPYYRRWYYVILDNLSSCFPWFTCCYEWVIFKSINLVVGVILCHISPKSLPLGMLLFVVLANDPSYLFIILVEEVFISSSI